MSKKKPFPKSQYRQYQTRSRALRKEAANESKPVWPIYVGVAAVVVILAIVLLVNRGPADGNDGDSARALAEIPAADRVGYFSSPPEFEIDVSIDYQARISTEKGDVLVDLFEKESPITVNNFVFLAQQGYYDNVSFHRVLDGFMAQSGDPGGTGAGGPGYAFEDEVENGLAFDQAGLLAMANSGPNTNGSQFFITFAPTPHLTGLHTIFGKILEGSQVMDQITRRDPQTNPSFSGDLINRIDIITDGGS